VDARKYVVFFCAGIIITSSCFCGRKIKFGKQLSTIGGNPRFVSIPMETKAFRSTHLAWLKRFPLYSGEYFRPTLSGSSKIFFPPYSGDKFCQVAASF
jgi:hypothetical protein